MSEKRNILVIPEEAEAKNDQYLVWVATSESEAARMVAWLKDLGITARQGNLEDIKSLS